MKLEKIRLTRRHLAALLTVVLAVVLDQVSKLLVVKNMELYESFTVIPYLFNFTFVTNRGAAWGMLADNRWVFMSVSTVAIIALAIFLIYSAEKMGYLYITAISFIIAGGIGNMIDRVRLQYVIDFIEFGFVEFPIFNVADSFVCVGAFLAALALIIDIIADARKAKKTKSEEDENALDG